MRALSPAPWARKFLGMAAFVAVAFPAAAGPPDAPTVETRPEFPLAAPGREARLEARLRDLEARVAALSGGVGPVPARPAPTPAPAPTNARFDSPAPVAPVPLKAVFGPGFELKSADDEFQWQFHTLTQVDARVFRQGGQDPVKDTFAVPRQWYIFSGRVTKPFEYLVSCAHAFGGTSLLDAWVNVHFDDRFQVKAGRYFVPFTFEPYVLPVHALITPEFSLFFNNFEPNRDLGVMAWGRLARNRIDYAAGVFNGTKNGFVDDNNAKDVIGFLNTKPFLKAGIPALENLNVGGSVDFGDQANAPNPQTLRTTVSIPGNSTIGVSFLSFNNNVRESGARALWSLHAAYYYRGLSLIGEWDGGTQGYSGGGVPTRTRLPVRSFYVEAGYFLTGETVSARGVVRPRRPFDLRKGRAGPGAWELAGRYNFLGLGGEVFSHGLADPNLWSDRVATVDLGLNWYWNPSVKVAAFWEHAEFGQPVVYRRGASQGTSDLFLVRVQLRF